MDYLALETLLSLELPVLIAAGIIVLILLTISTKNGQAEGPDRVVLCWFTRVKKPVLDRFFAGLTWFGSLWVLLPASAVISLILLNNGQYFQSMIFEFGFLGAVTSTYALKYALARERPDVAPPIDGHPPDPAFPSAHTTQAFAFAFMMFLLAALEIEWISCIVWPMIVVATGVAISRLYLQVHYPSDVLAGIIVALLWPASILYFFKIGVL